MDMVMLYPPDARINIFAPVVRGRKGEFKRELAALRARGIHPCADRRRTGRARSATIELDRRRNHTIDVLVDRLVIKDGIERRLTDSLELALKLADEIVIVNTMDDGDRLFSRRMACPNCGISIPEKTPRAFSFNSPHGACPDCQGLGAVYDFDPARVVPDDTRSLREGAVAPWAAGDEGSIAELLEGLARAFGIDSAVPFRDLPKKHREIILNGAPGGAARQPAAPPAPSSPSRTSLRWTMMARRRRDAPQGAEGGQGRAGPVRRRFRGRAPEPPATLRDWRLGRPGGARAVPRASAVPGLRGRAPQAREPARSASRAAAYPST